MIPLKQFGERLARQMAGRSRALSLTYQRPRIQTESPCEEKADDFIRRSLWGSEVQISDRESKPSHRAKKNGQFSSAAFGRVQRYYQKSRILKAGRSPITQESPADHGPTVTIWSCQMRISA